MVEVQDDKQLNTSLLLSYLVQVKRHASLNSSQGADNAYSVDGMSDEIQSAFADQSVSRAYQLIRKWDNKPISLG
jgi:hypothetical protein